MRETETEKGERLKNTLRKREGNATKKTTKKTTKQLRETEILKRSGK